MLSSQPLTVSLALALGIYAIAIAIGMFRDPTKLGRILEGFKGNAALTFLTGALTYVLGVTVVIVHPSWDGWLAAFVTLMGWATIAKGLLWMVAPDGVLAIAGRFWRNPLPRTWALATGAFGLALVIGAVV
jgi:hypothetical protein